MCAAEIGFGLGLRPEHYEEIAASPGRVSWFEALSENYMVPGGGPLHWLDRFRRDYPMALHGVSLSIGSIDPPPRPTIITSIPASGFPSLTARA